MESIVSNVTEVSDGKLIVSNVTTVSDGKLGVSNEKIGLRW